MGTTGQQIVDSAFGRSAAARPDLLSTDEPELLRVLNKATLARYMMAAHRNPLYFGTTEPVAYQSATAPAGWQVPTAALTVFRVEATGATVPAMTAGSEIDVIRHDDRGSYEGKPSLYFLGRTLVPSGNAGDPTGGTLTVWYSRSPSKLTSLTQALDATWPEDWNALLELPVAQYLARKDARTDDLEAFAAEEREWLTLFDAYLGDQVVAMKDRFGEFRAADLKPHREQG